MTMPHLMNCDHSEEGWCLGCVKALWLEKQELEEECERLEKLVPPIMVRDDPPPKRWFKCTYRSCGLVWSEGAIPTKDGDKKCCACGFAVREVSFSDNHPFRSVGQ